MRADAVEARLRRGTTPLGGVRPRYEDLGLPNLMASALEAARVPAPSPPIPDEVLDADLLRSRQIVILAVDGLGYQQLLAAKKELGGLALLDAAKADGALFPISSTCPSTTVAAIGSLCTAVPPQDHGLIGYRLFLREFGGIANMIRFAPIDRSGPPYDPAGFVPVPTAFELAARKRVSSRVLTRGRFLGSALSKMVHRGAEVAGYVGASDFGVHLRHALTQRRRKLVFAYWDLIDSICHTYGTRTEEFYGEVATFDSIMEREVLRKAKDVTLLLTADHGHVNALPKGHLDLRKRSTVLDAIAMQPTGEPRLLYLHAKDGDAKRLAELAADAFRGKARVCTATEAFEAGLFGVGPPPPKSVDRVGDVLVMPTGTGAIFGGFVGEHPDLVGRHGGLTADEMLVPCLVARI